jgi:hypothetical protein
MKLPGQRILDACEEPINGGINGTITFDYEQPTHLTAED